MIKEEKKKNRYTCIHIVFVTFVIIFKFKLILIYLLHMLFVFKIKGIFENKISTQKCVERDSFFYI